MNRTVIASRARALITAQTFGTLSTLSQSLSGHPFGSITPYDVTDNGDTIIYISLISEHYKNLIKDSRGSLIVTDYNNYTDIQASARATLLCNFNIVPKQEESIIKVKYENRFPKSINHEIAHNFVFMRGTPIKIRWIGGFGDIAWVTPDEYRAANVDPISYFSKDIIDHLNLCHCAGIRKLVQKSSSANIENLNVIISSLCKSSFSITVYGSGKPINIDINFGREILTPEMAREEFIKLIKN